MQLSASITLILAAVLLGGMTMPASAHVLGTRAAAAGCSALVCTDVVDCGEGCTCTPLAGKAAGVSHSVCACGCGPEG